MVNHHKSERSPICDVAQQEGLRILVAEDDEISRRMMMKHLGRSEHFFDVVENGEKAWEQAQKEHYDVILLDVRMPGMDGMSVAQHIRVMEKTSGKKVYMIGLSAHASDEIKRACLDAGMDDFFMKPVSIEKLSALLSLFAKRGEAPLQQETVV